MEETLIFRLRKRAEIRRQIPSRKSVQEGQPDRIADLLEEAANRIEQLERANAVFEQTENNSDQGFMARMGETVRYRI